MTKKRKLANAELTRLNIEEFREAKKNPIILILDNVRSLNNIGSIFRTGDAFLIKKIYLCGITATPPHRDIHKTALGATETVKWEYAENSLEVIEKLKLEDIRVIAVEQAENSISLDDFLPEDQVTYAFIFGNEVRGVSQEAVNQSDQVLEIPQYGTKHSLNISVSTGIVLWDICSKILNNNIQ